MQNVSIKKQLELAVRAENRLSTGIAALMGFVVPLSVYSVTHELPNVYAQHGWISFPFLFLCILGIAGCVFSAKSVYQWGILVFADKFKAAGFAVLLEGILSASGIVSESLWFKVLGMISLAYLMLINAINCGTNIILSNKEFQREMREQAKTKKRK
jgi:hypothetical protein